MRRAVLCALLLTGVLASNARADVQLAQVGDFEQPLQVLSAPGEPGIYVVEQSGSIQAVRDGGIREFADLQALLATSSERGLLAAAFPPDFASSRLLYVFYTAADGSLTIDELRAPSGTAIDPSYRRPVIAIPHTEAANHNGGQLQFGPDGYLYAATGDGGNGYDEPVRDASDPNSLLGKILRIDPRGAAAGQYGIPADNPFAGGGGRGEVYSYGLRNPWRFSFDASGALWIADVGQDTAEEIDMVAAGAGRGAFFGWDECEGNFDADPAPGGRAPLTQPCTLTGDVRPLRELLQSDGFCSVIGGSVVRDPSLPSLAGRYVYGDFCKSPLRSMRTDGDDDGALPGLPTESLTSIGEDLRGCLYTTSRDGPVHRIVETDLRPVCDPDTPTPPSQPGPSGPVGDVREPLLRTRAAKRQRVLRHRGVIAYGRCDEACILTLSGQLKIGPLSYKLRRAERDAAPNSRARLKASLPKRAARALRKALRRGKRPLVHIAVRARDATGNTTQLVRLTVRVRR